MPNVDPDKLSFEGLQRDTIFISQFKNKGFEDGYQKKKIITYSSKWHTISANRSDWQFRSDDMWVVVRDCLNRIVIMSKMIL